MDITSHLTEQLEWHWTNQARPRLEGLTDEEYLWEPAPGAWNVRRAEDPAPDTVTLRAGGGDWLVDYAVPAPEPAPVTSIAWRLAHVVVGVLGTRARNHFGADGVVDYDTWEVPGTAKGALRELDRVHAEWTEGVRALTPEQLDAPVGEAEPGWTASPMIGLVLHINREVIHHLAEVALLRDLWEHGAARR